MSTRLRIRVSAPARHEYHVHSPGKARGRWGYFRRGYPVMVGGRPAVFIGLERLPPGPEGEDARAYARAYGRDGVVAILFDDIWEVETVPMAEISPPRAPLDLPDALTVRL